MLRCSQPLWAPTEQEFHSANVTAEQQEEPEEVSTS